MTLINSYGLACTTGDSVESLWQELQNPSPPPLDGEFLFRGELPATVQELLINKLLIAWQQLTLPKGRLGVILASTKGISNDFIWQTAGEGDPLTPLLTEFLARTKMQPEKSICISNACSSALAAMRLGQLWLGQDLDHVLILATDAVTPFVRQGFRSLKLVSDAVPRPFDAQRRGFFLGEAAACLVLSKDIQSDSVRLLPVGLDTEGSAVTRPSFSGESLIRAATRVPGIPRARSIDLLIAHGTGTKINDETEDLAFAHLFEGSVLKPWLTGSKWRVGHTLAASGAIDIILACEVLKRGQSFALQTTQNIDPQFRCRYLLPGTKVESFSRVMISSLGFGGMHATAVVEPPAETHT